MGFLVGCQKDILSSEESCQTKRRPCLTTSATVALDTSRGRVILQLDGKNAPLTAGNFQDLVKKGVYNQTLFHRVVKSPVPFVVQGGDPLTADPKIPASSYGSGQYVDPITRETRYVPLEFRVKPSKRLIYGREISDPGSSLKPILPHERGSVAMARSTDPNSASSQFYIALEALPELDGRYAVFGRVVSGMDVVDQLEQGDKLIRATILPN